MKIRILRVLSRHAKQIRAYQKLDKELKRLGK